MVKGLVSTQCSTLSLRAAVPISVIEPSFLSTTFTNVERYMYLTSFPFTDWEPGTYLPGFTLLKLMCFAKATCPPQPASEPGRFPLSRTRIVVVGIGADFSLESAV